MVIDVDSLHVDILLPSCVGEQVIERKHMQVDVAVAVVDAVPTEHYVVLLTYRHVNLGILSQTDKQLLNRLRPYYAICLFLVGIL
jgi:hypothetical protein